MYVYVVSVWCRVLSRRRFLSSGRPVAGCRRLAAFLSQSPSAACLCTSSVSVCVCVRVEVCVCLEKPVAVSFKPVLKRVFSCVVSTGPGSGGLKAPRRQRERENGSRKELSSVGKPRLAVLRRVGPERGRRTTKNKGQVALFPRRRSRGRSLVKRVSNAVGDKAGRRRGWKAGSDSGPELSGCSARRGSDEAGEREETTVNGVTEREGLVRRGGGREKGERVAS